MKVIVNNVKPEQTSWNFVCPKCNSMLEYTKDDVVSHESMFFCLHYIKCPCCNKHIDVPNWLY